MKRTKRLALLMAVILVAALIVTVLVSCEAPITFDEAFDAMQKAIESSRSKTNYYNSVKYYKGNYEQNLRYQVIPENESTEAYEEMRKFTVRTTDGYGATPLEQYYSFGYSLSKDVKKKKATKDDYKPYMFYNIYGAKNAIPDAIKDANGNAKTMRKPATGEDFVNGVKTGLFNPVTEENDVTMGYADLSVDFILNDLSDLKKESIVQDGATFTEKGWTIAMVFKVDQPGHKYDGLQLRVELLHGNVSAIRYKLDNGVNVEYALVYNSPKIQLGSYDADNMMDWDDAITA